LSAAIREIAIDCELGAGDGKQMVTDRRRIGIDTRYIAVSSGYIATHKRPIAMSGR
jgi:hypothetical protein